MAAIPETVWITKYALTQGIYETRAYSGSISYGVNVSESGYDVYEPKHFTVTLAAARARAEEIRQAKIASLEKQLAKLRSMTIQEHPLAPAAAGEEKDHG